MYIYAFVYNFKKASAEFFFWQRTDGLKQDVPRRYTVEVEIMQHIATHCNMPQHAATHMQHRASTEQPFATGKRADSRRTPCKPNYCNTLQIHCNALQHTATHCKLTANTMQTLRKYRASTEQFFATGKRAQARHTPWRATLTARTSGVYFPEWCFFVFLGYMCMHTRTHTHTNTHTNTQTHTCTHKH